MHVWIFILDRWGLLKPIGFRKPNENVSVR